MVGQIALLENTKVRMSIDVLKEFEPAEGYYLAFSGGYISFSETGKSQI